MHGNRWDIFLSYRVRADGELVLRLYDKIKREDPSLKVFLDQKELKVGEGWESGFSKAIMNSRMVVFIISRGTFNCIHGRECTTCPENVAQLEAKGSCDNVILEYDLALELFELGRVQKLVPVLVGAQKEIEDLGKIYLDFFAKNNPGIDWNTVPDKVIPHIQSSALSKLEQDPELKTKLCNICLADERLKKNIPSLRMGRR